MKQKLRPLTLALIIVAVVITLAVVKFMNILSSTGENKIVRVKSITELKEIVRSHEKVVVLFESTTCPICSAVRKYWIELSKEGRGGILYVLATFNPNAPRDEVINMTKLFQSYGVYTVPTIIAFKNGRLVGVQVGVPAAIDTDVLYDIVTKLFEES